MISHIDIDQQKRNDDFISFLESVPYHCPEDCDHCDFFFKSRNGEELCTLPDYCEIYFNSKL